MNITLSYLITFGEANGARIHTYTLCAALSAGLEHSHLIPRAAARQASASGKEEESNRLTDPLLRRSFHR
jgi:hypothetical protein